MMICAAVTRACERHPHRRRGPEGASRWRKRDRYEESVPRPWEVEPSRSIRMVSRGFILPTRQNRCSTHPRWGVLRQMVMGFTTWQVMSLSGAGIGMAFMQRGLSRARWVSRARTGWSRVRQLGPRCEVLSRRGPRQRRPHPTNSNYDFGFRVARSSPPSSCKWRSERNGIASSGANAAIM